MIIHFRFLFHNGTPMGHLAQKPHRLVKIKCIQSQSKLVSSSALNHAFFGSFIQLYEQINWTKCLCRHDHLLLSFIQLLNKYTLRIINDITVCGWVIEQWTRKLSSQFPRYFMPHMEVIYEI